MSDLLRDILDSTRLEEGLPSLEKLLLTLYHNEALSTKQLANAMLLPLPVTAAVKKELVKRGMLQSGNGLTHRGRRFVEEDMRYGGLDEAAYRAALSPDCEPAALFGEHWKALTALFDGRPAAETRIDQSHCTADTSMRRALLCLRYGGLIGKRILCAGDDDLVSLSSAFLLRRLFPGQRTLAGDIIVLDIDQRYLSFIEEAATAHELPIRCIRHDFRAALPVTLTARFDSAFTDPPYTQAGLTLFLSRVVQGLRPMTGLPVMLSYAHRPPMDTLVLQRSLVEMGFVIDAILPRFNQYEGAAVLGGAGQLIALRTTRQTAGLVKEGYTAPIYTGELRRTTRRYRCRQCGRELPVGTGQRFETIELLKEKGCPSCGGRVFVRK